MSRRGEHRRRTDGRGGETAAPGRRSQRLPVRWVAAMLAMVLFGIAAWQLAGWWRQEEIPAAKVPEISLDQAAPGVARALDAARAKVLAAPSSADAWGELGMVLMAHQFEFEANVCLEQAARLNPNDFHWWYLLGVSLAVSDTQAAAGHFRRALELQPDLAVARVRLAELLLLEGQLESAAEQLDAAYRADSQDPRTHYDMAQLLAAQGDAAAALPWAEKAAQLAPDVRIVHDQLASLHRRLGQSERARQEIELAGQARETDLPWRDPVTTSVLNLRQDVTALLEHAQTLLDQDRTNEAVDVLRRGLEQDDRNPALYTTLARTWIQRNQLAEAEQVLQRAEQRHPESAEIHFQQGILHFVAQRYDAAEKSFRQAVRCQPNHALAFYNLGHVLLKLGRDDAAREAFESTIALRPDYADAHTNLAKLWLRRGEKERAVAYLQQARRLKPQDAEIGQLLDQSRGGPAP